MTKYPNPKQTPMTKAPLAHWDLGFIWDLGIWSLGFLLLLACGGCADSWLLYPSTKPLDAGGAQRRMLNFKGHRIEVFIARSEGVRAGGAPEAYSLEFCGNSMRAEFLAARAAKRWGARPVEVWSMNYPGFGRSDGPASLGLIPEYALATFDQLKSEARGKPVFVDGYSLGTTAALYVAAHRPAAGMILQSPPPLQAEIMQEYGWWNLWVIASITALEVPREMNSLANAPQVKYPAVFIITGHDTIVPRRYQMMVFDAFAGKKQCLLRPNDEHNAPMSSGDEIRLQQELDWLWSHKGG